MLNLTPLKFSSQSTPSLVSGPKHQIFLASVTSYSYLSAKYLPLTLKSSLGLTSPLSMSSARPSGMGTAFMKILLCLLGDLDRHMISDSSVTDSLYDTTGSDFLSGMPAWSSSRSLRQISRWSSPAPAIMCSPDSSMMHCTMGSDLANLFRPSTSLGKSAGFLGSTATLTTGETENFMTFML